MLKDAPGMPNHGSRVAACAFSGVNICGGKILQHPFENTYLPLGKPRIRHIGAGEVGAEPRQHQPGIPPRWTAPERGLLRGNSRFGPCRYPPSDGPWPFCFAAHPLGRGVPGSPYGLRRVSISLRYHPWKPPPAGEGSS